MKTIAIVSGGLDSVTLANFLYRSDQDLALLAFDYGQRHKKELEFAKMCAEDLGVPIDIIDLSGLRAVLSGSALTDDIPVPDGHYAASNMAITIVPNRNAIMLSIAYGVAVARKFEAVAIGVHGGDHFVYPDCRPEFVSRFSLMEQAATGEDIYLLAPFLETTKDDIVKMGSFLGIDYSRTWSCYKGGEFHCGTCGTCVERKEAFFLAGVKDPTRYEIA